MGIATRNKTLLGSGDVLLSLVVRHLFLVANIVTTSKALVTGSDALVPSSFLLSSCAFEFFGAKACCFVKRKSEKTSPGQPFGGG